MKKKNKKEKENKKPETEEKDFQIFAIERNSYNSFPFFLLQMKSKLKNIAHKALKKKIAKKGLKGEADRFIGTKMPKHLFSGKRGVGKTDRR